MSLLTACAWFTVAAAVTSLPGTVLDEGGRPVERATVWLTSRGQLGGEVQELARVETDASGRFTVDAPRSPERSSVLMLWAYTPGARVAFQSLENRPADDEGPIKLTLGPFSKLPVRVLGYDGKPVAGAKVRPTALIWPASLLDIIQGTTDAQGRAVIEDVRFAQVTRVDVTADGLGTQSHGIAADSDAKTVRLFPVGHIAAWVMSDEPTARAGWTVTASTRPEVAGTAALPTSRERSRSNESGKVAFDSLAAGLVTFEAVPPDGVPFLAVPPAPVFLRGGERVEVAIPVRRAVKIEGSVREHESGKPAAGVRVNLFRLSPGRGNEDAVTDSEGHFSRYVLPGKLRVSLTWFELPDRYYYAPDDRHWADYDLTAAEERHALAPLDVWPATVLKGTVVDEGGQPVAGAQVTAAAVARRFGQRPVPGNTLTDQHGAFVMGRMPPDSTVTVRGLITHRAEAPAVTVRLNADGVQDAPVTLRLVRKPTVSLRGRVLGPTGQPVPGADVKIVFQMGAEENAYGHGKDEQTRTGPDGTFRTPDGVPVADRYRASVTAPGMVPALSDWATAPSVVLPDVLLRRASRLREVTGRVVDSEANPVVGAEVFQSGEGPRRTSDTTDGEGRFTVSDVFDAPGFVFVKKDGYRFTGRKFGTGDEPVEIAVARVDGPAPRVLKRVPPRQARAEVRALARTLVAPLCEHFRPGQVEPTGPLAAAPTLALVDTDRIVTMVEDQVLRADGPLIANIALGLYEESPDDAVAALDALRPADAAAAALLDILETVGDVPAALRRAILDRALARAREADSPAREAALMARVADCWFDADAPEKARAVLDEARAAFKNLEPGAAADVRDNLAEPLAWADLAAALALVEGPNQQATLAGIARRIAASDPAGADRVFARVDDRAPRLNALADVCARMATRDLPKALDLAERSGGPGVAALAVAAAARGKAAADPVAARGLLADAFDRLERLPPGRMVVPAVAMARLVPVAVEVDPERSSEYLWRAVAARPPRAAAVRPGSTSVEIRRQYLVLAQLAALVTRYDRAAAETVFAPVAANSTALIEDRFDLANEAAAILQAAALFDPRAAETMVDGVPEDPEPPADRRTATPPRPDRRVKDKARLAAARALALPPAVSYREALRVPGWPDLWPALLRIDPPSERRTSP